MTSKTSLKPAPISFSFLSPFSKLLLQGFLLNTTPSTWLHITGYVGLAKTFLGNGVYNTGVGGKKGSILLRYAARGGHVPVMKLLLDGGHVRITDDYGWLIIYTATSHSRGAVIRFLHLELGVDVNQVSRRNGRTALHSAASSSGRDPTKKKVQTLGSVIIMERQH